ncbi:MAG: hypothetical protein JO062_00640 [Bryobacterales bacterium]|nr:hypothetical protein [Bryobacterales bacterium]
MSGKIWIAGVLAIAGQMHAKQILVTLDTSPLIGSAAGPFQITFELADGGIAGDGNNAVIVSDFRLGASSLGSSNSGNFCSQGSASGEFLELSMSDASGQAWCTFQLTPGNNLGFTVSYTTNVDSGIPDEFVVMIFDRLGNPIPTTGGVALFQLDFDSTNPTVKTFAGDPTQSEPANGGSGIPIPAPIVTPFMPAVTHFAVTGTPASVSVGTPFSFTVAALDANNNVVTNYSDLVVLELPYGMPNLGYLTSGMGVFSTTLSVPGPQTITVGDALSGFILGTSGTINATGVLVNLTSTPEGVPVTISGTGCAPGVLVTPATYVTPAKLGWVPNTTCSVRFWDPVIIGPASYGFQSWTVNGSAPSRANPLVLDSGTSTWRINATYSMVGGAGPGAATHFSVIPTTSTIVAGMPVQFTVSALDSSNRTVTSYSDPVHITSSDNFAQLPPDLTLTSGVGTFTASLATASSQTMTASDLFTSSITGTSSPINVSPASGLTFIPITPCRVMDTRPGRPFTGPFGVPYLSANTSRSIPISTGACGTFPGALAYSMNVTVVPHSTLSFLTIWPSGQPQPAHASTLNSLDGRYKANAAIVPAGTGGAVSVYVTDATDVILDINGYFVPNTTPGGLVFYPMTPCRVMDTRVGHGFTGVYGPPSLTPPFAGATSGTSRTLPVQSSTCTIPPTAQVYSFNFTVVPVAGAPLGWLSAWPTGQPEPSASILNAPTGTIVANAAIIPAGAGGSIDIFVHDATDAIVDINGYFAPPGPGGLSFYALPPCRVMDTRLARGGPGPFGGSIDDDILGVSTTGNVCGGTPSAQAYVFNATVVPPAPLPYLTLWPQGATLPRASTLNAIDGAITSNMAIVPTTNTEISAYANTPTDLILDLAGYFAP